MSAQISAVVTTNSRYDAIIIGTGLGGASLAHRLSHAGMRVLALERGGFQRPPASDVTPKTSYFINEMLGSREAPIHLVGGRTKFYGAALYRLRLSDFQEVQHRAGLSPAWPITYHDLEPYYEEAEALFRVHGATGGDPSEPPRRSPYPWPAIKHQSRAATVVERLKKSGTKVASIPTAIDYRDGHGACVLCSRCDAHYCALDAKMDAEIAAIRPALATGNLTLLTNAECLTVLTSANGSRTTGVLVRVDGEDRTYHCDTVAVCAGLPYSARLLRRSRTARHPEGLGNNTGVLGRYLGGHSTGMIFPFVSLGTIADFQTKTFAINEFYESAPDWPYPAGVIQAVGRFPFWEEASRVMRPIAKFVGAHSLMCSYMAEALPTRDAGFIFDGDDIKTTVMPDMNLEAFEKLRRLAVDVFRRAGYFSLARKRQPYLWHEIGSARMGQDARDSVVDPTLRVHDIDGLYVVDASVLPSAGAVNTGLTIIALALRTADAIAGSLHAARRTEPIARIAPGH
jgi:choline dehydrogenase-like flavoprotein